MSLSPYLPVFKILFWFPSSSKDEQWGIIVAFLNSHHKLNNPSQTFFSYWYSTGLSLVVDTSSSWFPTLWHRRTLLRYTRFSLCISCQGHDISCFSKELWFFEWIRLVCVENFIFSASWILYLLPCIPPV